MRRLPTLTVPCSTVPQFVQPLIRAGVVAVILAALFAVAASSTSAQETLPAAIPDVDERTFVIARVLACPDIDADPASCESLPGVTLSILLDGIELPNGALVTAMNPIGSYSADFLAGTSQWLSITAIDGLPEGYALVAGSDPYMALVADLPFQGCGGESLCQYADLVVVPTGGENPPPDPQPAPEASTVTVYSVLCPAGTEPGALFETCYDAPAVGMPYRAGRPYTEFPETTTLTDAAGFVAFSVGGETARVIQELPFAATIAVYCTADGAETGVAIVDSGNPALGVADVTLSGSDVRCDWYTIPAAGSDVPVEPASPYEAPTDPVTAPVDPVTAPAGDVGNAGNAGNAGDAGEDPAPVAPTAPAAPAGKVAVTALPNTGAGPAGTPAGMSTIAWIVALAGLCAAVGSARRLIAR